jgi:trans-aconitate methyltransferase
VTARRDADPVDQLLAEQISYYRARAPEYLEGALEDLSEREAAAAERQLLAALAALPPTGDVLELACGPGTWTEQLLDGASSVTAVDASPEMLELAAARVPAGRVRFTQADLFSWRPDRRYDTVFFGFWLSHVPLERFEAFWATVAGALAPGGLVIFVDDGFRAPHELVEGEQSSTIRRRLSDGTAFRAVKVPHSAGELEERLAKLGWEVKVRQLAGPFYLGMGRRRD